MITIKRTIEISADVDAALARVAEAGAQSPSQIIESALVSFLSDAAETVEDERRWENYLKTRKAIPIEAVKAWVDSWDTDNELPVPTPRKFRFPWMRRWTSFGCASFCSP